MERLGYEVADRGHETPCWIWLGVPDRDGYAETARGGRYVRLHRWMYERLVGPIPDGLTIDHLCRQRACLNPAHMEPVTIAENVRRRIPHQSEPRTHCPHGHEFTSENTKPRAVGRHCRTCQREQQRARRARKRRAALLAA